MKTNEAARMNNSTTAATSTSNENNQTSQERGDNSIVIHCDGAGSRPDGKGSGFAWIQSRTGERHIERVDGLTNNQAEYRALISVLTTIPDGSVAQVLTDSQLMWSQVIGNYRVRDPELCQLAIASSHINKGEISQSICDGFHATRI
jgi:ribonuclease HI